MSKATISLWHLTVSRLTSWWHSSIPASQADGILLFPASQAVVVQPAKYSMIGTFRRTHRVAGHVCACPRDKLAFSEVCLRVQAGQLMCCPCLMGRC